MSKGVWIKLICGASNQDLVSISDLCALYAAAGVHCIDVAADLAVIHAAKEGLDWAQSHFGVRPWLMVSVSDGRDAHFRKADFDITHCVANCSRPCEQVCPADAINFLEGVNPSLCYGCGRCIPVCPIGIIQEKDNLLEIDDLAPLLSRTRPDAVEIHTSLERRESFEKVVKAIGQSEISFQRVAVSCGLQGNKASPQVFAEELWHRFDCLRKYNQKPLWQLDGRPMSGDLGGSTTKFSIALWQQVRPIAPPGPLQLAGGTNAETINHLPHHAAPDGVAFGGIARKLVKPFLLEAQKRHMKLVDWPEGWSAALDKAKGLVAPWLLLSKSHGFFMIESI